MDKNGTGCCQLGKSASTMAGLPPKNFLVACPWMYLAKVEPNFNGQADLNQCTQLQLPKNQSKS